LNADDSKFVLNEGLIEKLTRLTDKESKILKLIASNLTSEQIATKLFASKHTIKTHRKSISQKLELENEQNSLLKFAIKYNNYLN
jgi:DNA-binding CsgD family transcriptional regulator